MFRVKTRHPTAKGFYSAPNYSFADELRDRVGLPLVRFPVRRGYAASDIEKQIEAAIGVVRPE